MQSSIFQYREAECVNHVGSGSAGRRKRFAPEKSVRQMYSIKPVLFSGAQTELVKSRPRSSTRQRRRKTSFL